jgi:hypothetical protein
MACYLVIEYNIIMQSRAHIQANTRYENKAIDKITFRLRKDGGSGITREDVQRAAAAAGESVNEFVLNAVKDRIDGR